MTHVSDDELVLHYYGDPSSRAAVPAHLDTCVSCAARYAELEGTLAMVPAGGVAERDERYGLAVWQRIRPELVEPEPISWRHPAWLGVAASAVLLVTAVLLGNREAPPVARNGAANVAAVSEMPIDSRLRHASGGQESRRVLLMSIADHLERSDRVLTEIMNVEADAGIGTQQGWAEDLLFAGRVYRQSALESEEHSVAAVLDDVERTLLDIVHTPAEAAGPELDDVRRRMDSAALLFKVRVLRDELYRQQIDAPDSDRVSTLSQTS